MYQDEVIDEEYNAIELATRAHYGQRDKLGELYIFHCIRVMMKFPIEQKDKRIVAVLHDTIEDTELEYEHLHEAGFSVAVIAAIEALTKLDDEHYDEYLERVKSNPIALAVKKADIADNQSRLNELYRIDRQTARRLDNKYHNAMRILNRK